MNLDQIRNFYQVAVHKSFTLAAEKLYRTQPAVSTQVRRFDRIGRRVCLTEAGEILFSYAERMLRLHDEAKLAVSELNATTKGRLLIGANEATCIYVLPRIFTVYKQRHPEVQISIYRNFSKKVVEKIRDNQLDFGIVTLPVLCKDLVVTPLFEDELWLITSPTHPLAARSAASLTELVAYPMIFHKAGTTRERIMKHFGKLAEKLNISFELASIETIKKFVAIGMGVSIVPKSYALLEAESGTLRLIPIKNLRIVRKLGLIYRRDRYLSRASKAFLEVLKESLNEDQWRENPAQQAPLMNRSLKMD
jgi:DNA-binding transcriptional LysR family regulator